MASYLCWRYRCKRTPNGALRRATTSSFPWLDGHEDGATIWTTLAPWRIPNRYKMGYILPHILLLSPRLPSLAAIDIPAPTMGECVQEKQTRVRTTNGEEVRVSVSKWTIPRRCEHSAAGFWNEGKEISKGSRSQTKRNAYVGANENDYDNSRRRRRRRGGEEMDNTIRNHETTKPTKPQVLDGETRNKRR